MKKFFQLVKFVCGTLGATTFFLSEDFKFFGGVMIGLGVTADGILMVYFPDKK